MSFYKDILSAGRGRSKHDMDLPWPMRKDDGHCRFPGEIFSEETPAGRMRREMEKWDPRRGRAWQTEGK